MSRGRSIRWYESRRPGRGCWEWSPVPPLLRSLQTAPRSERPRNVSIGQRSLRCWSDHTWGKRGEVLYLLLLFIFIIFILGGEFKQRLFMSNSRSTWQMITAPGVLYFYLIYFPQNITCRLILYTEKVGKGGKMLQRTADSGLYLKVMLLYF